MSLEEDFFYPGSKTPRQTMPKALPDGESGPSALEEAIAQLDTPVTFAVAGKDVEFFMIGQLANALGRAPTTLRRWEAQGIIPKSGYTKPSLSRDPRGKRRLYTRAQVEGIIEIAIEEGIMGSGRIQSTDFSSRVIALFRELKGQK